MADSGFDLGSRSTLPIATDWHDGQITELFAAVQATLLACRGAPAV
jgi:hypothetical protein